MSNGTSPKSMRALGKCCRNNNRRIPQCAELAVLDGGRRPTKASATDLHLNSTNVAASTNFGDTFSSFQIDSAEFKNDIHHDRARSSSVAWHWDRTGYPP